MSKSVAIKSDSLRVLKPGEYDIVSSGHGVPPAGLPAKCIICGKAVRAGESWRKHDNGQYQVIVHSVCDGMRG